MSGFYRLTVKLVFTAIFVCGIFLSTTSSTLSQENLQKEWKQQSIAEFEQWRESIPDYEKRLYDRVKKINKRTVQLTRIMIFGFLINIIVMGCGLYFIMKRINGFGLMKEFGSLGEPQNKMTVSSTGPTNYVLLLQVKENQKKLRQAVNNLNDYYLESHAFEKEIEWIRQSAEERLRELENSFEGEPNVSKGEIEKKQVDLSRALEELRNYWEDSRNRTQGLSRLVEQSEKKLTELDESLPKLYRELAKD